MIGAISESIGEYGGKIVLATPIEAILGKPLDGPAKRGRALARAMRAGDAPPQADAAPLSAVSGLSAPRRPTR